MVELSVELEVANHPAAQIARVVLEEDWEVPEVRLLLKAAVAALEVAGAAVAVSQVPQASLLLAVAVTAAKVCLPVSPALQASRLAAAYNATY
jgi:hypothetical protein